VHVHADDWRSTASDDKVDTGYHTFVILECEVTSKQWMTAAEDCGCKLPGVTYIKRVGGR